MEKNYYQFQLSFKGDLIENSVDAFDVANTILATSQVLQEISSILYGEEVANDLKININAFKKGSLATDFILLYNDIKEATAPLIPVVGTIYQTGKSILSTYKTYIDVRKFLKGEAPKEIKTVDNNNIQIVAKDNTQINITYNDFRVLQSKTISKNMTKSFQPLTKEDTLLSEIKVTTEDDEEFFVDKKESAYFTTSSEIQEVPEMKLKATVSKIDTKARSGYLDMPNKRVPFNYDKNLEQSEFELLVDSLKKRFQIYLIGSVRMDLEGNPASMYIKSVDSDNKLF